MYLSGSDKYVIYIEKEVLYSTDNFVERYVSIVEPEDTKSANLRNETFDETLVPQEIISSVRFFYASIFSVCL